MKNVPLPPSRRRLPDERVGVTRKFHIERGQDPLRLYVTVGEYEDGKIGELFLKADRQGSLASGALDAVAMMISVGLQYGVPLEAFTEKLIGMRFEPAGFTGDEDKRYKNCTSVLDLIGRWLRDRYAPGTETEEK
jgi:ribonucleoside-diphosphate reductase alpha chain